MLMHNNKLPRNVYFYLFVFESKKYKFLKIIFRLNEIIYPFPLAEAWEELQR